MLESFLEEVVAVWMFMKESGWGAEGPQDSVSTQSRQGDEEQPHTVGMSSTGLL